MGSATLFHLARRGLRVLGQGVQNGIDRIRGTTTVVPKAGTVLVFKLRKA
jgi:hypothetical protein